MKFTLGLLLGLSIGYLFFHYQVKKVDEYSMRVSYIAGRVDENQAQEGSAVVVYEACSLYNAYHLDTPPFGYTKGPIDKELKDLCPRP